LIVDDIRFESVEDSARAVADFPGITESMAADI